LNAAFADDGGLPREVLLDLVNRVPSEELLEPALSPRAREVLMFTMQDQLGERARGRLSIAAGSGGELTEVAEAGSLEQIDHTRRNQ